MLISVIIPTFNRRECVAQAIESVLSQRCADYELIVVDDGSTDNTFEHLSVHYPSVKVIQKENGGVASARNAGIMASSGELISFLDSDDLWLPDKLGIQRAFFQEQAEAMICQTEEKWVRNGRPLLPKPHHAKHSGWIFEECIPLCIVSPSAVMMRRNLFDEVGFFNEELKQAEDYELWLRISRLYPIFTLPEPLIIKRGGHSDQLSMEWGIDRYRIMALEGILKYPLNSGQEKLVLDDIIRRCKILSEGFRKRSSLAEAAKYQEKMEKYQMIKAGRAL